MIMHPGIVALTVGSVLVSGMAVASAVHGVNILRHWDLASGSERQLSLEKRTYLVSTLMSYVFAYQLGSLFLFIFTADKLSPLFVGAMCAAGTLNANGWGYPALCLKLINFLLGGVWLIVNYTDHRAVDYPLIRKKYLLLLLIAPLVVLEMAVQGAYFFSLDAHVITSCCGSIFSSDSKSLAAAFTALPSLPMKVVFFVTVGITGLIGLAFLRLSKPRIGVAFSLMSGVALVVSVAALISVISVYFYQLPTHHCPFCLLQKEYSYVGYLLYLGLLAGGVSGAATGALLPARGIPSLRTAGPAMLRRLTVAALVSYLIFTVIAVTPMIFGDFRLECD